jgi:hypothetical protein
MMFGVCSETRPSVALISERAPNDVYAERFVRSIKEECLDRIIPVGERHFRHALAEFVEHYHRERNHQGLNNRLNRGQTGERPDRRRAVQPANRLDRQHRVAGGGTVDRALNPSKLTRSM